MPNQKNVEIFNRIYSKNKERFIRFAQSYLYTKDIAEDIVMDSFMYYWENIDSLDSEQNIEIYILKVIKHKSLNYLKRLQKQREIGNHLLKMEAWELDIQISTLEACNPEQLFSAEIQEIIAKAVHMLPQQTRDIFIRSRYDNQSHTEIAQALNLSTKSVEYHITKALKLLRVALKDYFPLLFIIHLYFNNN